MKGVTRGAVEERRQWGEEVAGGNVAIIGYGHVGRAMQRLFPNARIYDKFDPEYADLDDDQRKGRRQRVQGADLALVCVPTPQLPDGSADVEAVWEVCGWLDARLICIKSAVPPGTTAAIRAHSRGRVTVSPEYEGETAWQKGAREWPYVIVGGERPDADAVLAYFEKALGPDKLYLATDDRTAELVKYMENVWLALQVTFANEFSRIAGAVGANWREARTLWALDPRVSATHTLVFDDAPGFAGKCLPKDLSAIIASATEAGYLPAFLIALQKANEGFRCQE